MKRITDYTEKELLALSEIEVATLAEIECMIDGVQSASYPGPEPMFGEGLKQTTYFTIHERILFSTVEDAREALSLATHTMDYTSLAGTYSAKPSVSSDVSLVSYYDYDDLVRVQTQKIEYEKVHNAWEKKARLYNEYCRGKDKAESRVYSVISEAKEAQETVLERERTYEKYLALSESEEIADNFFRDMLLNKKWSDEDITTEIERIHSK